ncbi:PREDICTED: uncharacterized protein LOC101297995 [Fragaria vesca subsp. vesca]
MCIRRFLGITKNARRDSILMEKTCLYGSVGDVVQLGTHPSNLCMPFGGGRKIYEHKKIKVETTASDLVEWLSVQVKNSSTSVRIRKLSKWPGSVLHYIGASLWDTLTLLKEKKIQEYVHSYYYRFCDFPLEL